MEAGEYRIAHGTLAVESVPVLYWPYTAGQFKRGEMALRRVRVGYRDDFGVVAQTKWHLFSLLGLQESCIGLPHFEGNRRFRLPARGLLRLAPLLLCPR